MVLARGYRSEPEASGSSTIAADAGGSTGLTKIVFSSRITSANPGFDPRGLRTYFLRVHRTGTVPLVFWREKNAAHDATSRSVSRLGSSLLLPRLSTTCDPGDPWTWNQ